jgi:iodotyrosine deiodinase
MINKSKQVPTLDRLMKGRRSIRKYLRKRISKAMLTRVLKAAYYAPSGADRSGYHLVVVGDVDLKAKIRKSCEAADAAWHDNATPWLKKWLKMKGITPIKPFLEDAPYLICVFGDNTSPYWLGSTWLGVAYMLLAAEREGLATLTYTPGKSRFLQKLLNVKSHMIPIVILPIGFPDEQIPAKKIKPGTIVYFDRMTKKNGVDLGGR